jgi:hypothetical protein
MKGTQNVTQKGYSPLEKNAILVFLRDMMMTAEAAKASEIELAGEASGIHIFRARIQYWEHVSSAFRLAESIASQITCGDGCKAIAGLLGD